MSRQVALFAALALNCNAASLRGRSLFLCPQPGAPDYTAPKIGLSLGASCGGTCGFAGTCREGLVCGSKSCTTKATELMMGIQPEGICVQPAVKPAENLAGGIVSQNVCDTGAQEAASQAALELSKQSNSLYRTELVNVLAASSQVVAGIKWNVTFTAALSTNCKKSKSQQDCTEGGSSSVDTDTLKTYTAMLINQDWEKLKWTVLNLTTAANNESSESSESGESGENGISSKGQAGTCYSIAMNTLSEAACFQQTNEADCVATSLCMWSGVGQQHNRQLRALQSEPDGIDFIEEFWPQPVEVNA